MLTSNCWRFDKRIIQPDKVVAAVHISHVTPTSLCVRISLPRASTDRDRGGRKPASREMAMTTTYIIRSDSCRARRRVASSQPWNTHSAYILRAWLCFRMHSCVTHATHAVNVAVVVVVARMPWVDACTRAGAGAALSAVHCVPKVRV